MSRREVALGHGNLGYVMEGKRLCPCWEIGPGVSLGCTRCSQVHIDADIKPHITRVAKPFPQEDSHGVRAGVEGPWGQEEESRWLQQAEHSQGSSATPVVTFGLGTG